MIGVRTLQWPRSKRLDSDCSGTVHMWLFGAGVCKALRAAVTTTVKLRLGLLRAGEATYDKRHIVVTKTLDGIPPG